MTRETFAVRPFERSDQDDVLALLTASLGGGPAGERTGDFFQWKHFANPFGQSPGLVALDEDRIIGVRLFLRWELETLNHRLRALRAVDTATHPAFQGLGIFRTLTLRLLHQLEQQGEVDLVFNTPNASSRPGYLKMGWEDVGSLPVRLGVGKPVRFLRGVRGANSATAASSRGNTTGRAAEAPLPRCPYPPAGPALAQLGREIDDLLGDSSPERRLHTPRTREYLLWRYADAPGLDYRCITLKANGRLTGAAIGRMRRRGPLNEFTVSEVLVRSADRRTAGRLLALARRSGADHVAVHTSEGFVGSAARRAGYVTVPHQGVGLVTNPRRRLPMEPLDLRSWQLSLGDLEVF